MSEEQKAEAALKEAGIAIVTEDGGYEIGEMTRHRVVGRDTNGEDEFEALGDNRADALKALLVVASAR